MDRKRYRLGYVRNVFVIECNVMAALHAQTERVFYVNEKNENKIRE